MNSAKKTSLLIFLMLVPLFQGCAGKTEPVQPVTFDQSKKHSAQALTAERRLVITGGGEDERSVPKRRVICAEPSPDALEAISQIFSVSKESKTSSAALSAVLTSEPFSIFPRSQGVQFYRDTIFALCQMSMNGWIETAASRSTEILEMRDRALKQYYAGYNRYQESMMAYRKLEKEYYECLLKSEEKCQEPKLSPKKLISPARGIISELEEAMYKTRKDAKDIIIEEVTNPKMTQQFIDQLERLRKAQAQKAFDNEAAAINEAKVKLLESIIGNLAPPK